MQGNYKITFVSYEQSCILKGIAILMMIILHLFAANQMYRVDDFLFVGDVPFCQWLTAAMNPVSVYLFISGYGLYNKQITCDLGRRGKRVLKLYVIWWTSLIIMVGMGCFVRSDIYPGKISDVICNVTAYHTTWNAQAWFLLPYVCMVMIAPYVFRVYEKLGSKVTLAVSFILYYVSSYMISRFGGAFLYDNSWAYIPVVCTQFFIAFLVGATFCKYADFTFRCNKILMSNPVIIFSILLTVCAECMIRSAAMVPLEFLFIFLLTRIHWKGKSKDFMLFMGRHSTTMWLTHSFFCYYLFGDFVYSFRYPILIFIIELLCSILASVVVKSVSDKLIKITIH